MTAVYAVPPRMIPYWLWLHAQGVLDAVAEAALCGQGVTSHPVPADSYPQWLTAFRIQAAGRSAGRGAFNVAAGPSPYLVLVTVDVTAAAPPGPAPRHHAHVEPNKPDM